VFGILFFCDLVNCVFSLCLNVWSVGGCGSFCIGMCVECLEFVGIGVNVCVY